MNDYRLKAPISDVRCTQCGGARLFRADGTIGVCSFIPCPKPLHDVDVERAMQRTEALRVGTVEGGG